MKKNKNIKTGFTLIETIVAISLFTIVILTSNSMFVMSQKIYKKGSALSELSQNARISLDKISRELRQSNDLITDFSLISTSSEIFFQDGHDNNEITYIKYFASSTDLIRKNLAYEFSANPGVYVYYGSIDAWGQPPDEIMLEERIVGEYFNTLEFSFSSSSGLVNIYINLNNTHADIKINSKAHIRNW
ncbi:MAG: prepilin-type N-terminal cleavage/methylation domain-containing protein [Patescibacteria group bacterium]|nr:prepilin-type N-terminal cleavage/methylation domain-containing protein [Patescibacteria group bacterium]